MTKANCIPLTALRLDGRNVTFQHGVAIVHEDPHSMEWHVALLGISTTDLGTTTDGTHLLSAHGRGSRHLRGKVTVEGITGDGTYMCLLGTGPLVTD